jgi:hypothetical protein
MRGEKTVVSTLILALGFSIQAAADESALLKLPLFPVPIVRQHVPLTRALADIGVFARDGYVLFGVEVRVKDHEEPVVDVNLPPGSTLGDGMRQVLAQLPDYTFRVVSAHLINVLPQQADRDPNDLLNILVARFDVVDQHPARIFSAPDDFIGELTVRLRPAGGGVVASILEGVNDPRITLHLRNVTVRQIFNAVTEATENFPEQWQPLGWVWLFNDDPTFKTDPHLPAGGRYSSSFLSSVPQDWKTQREKQRVQ